jgi:molybdopterin converting factor subunit 1
VNVEVRLYAGVKERAGQSRLEVEASDIASLRAALARACPAIAAQLASCRFALDDEFVGEDAPLRAGTVVDLIPPVSGG